MFPDGAREGPVSHRRRDAVVLPRASSATCDVTGDADTLRQLLPTLRRHRRSIICAARGSASASIRADGLLRQGAEGYQLTWMDAKVDDWVVTPRRGKAVEINALWYNALRLLRGMVNRRSAACRKGWISSATPTGSASRSTGGSGTPRAAICTTSSTAKPATIRRAGRIRCSRSRSTIRCSIATRWEPVLRGRPRAAADAGRPALAGAGPSRLQGRSTTATCARATPPTTRARSGRWLIGPFVDAWLKAVPGRQRAAPAHLLDGFDEPSRRGVRRIDQRSLRRRSAVHATRLHRPGVERRRGAALSGEDGRLAAERAARSPRCRQRDRADRRSRLGLGAGQARAPMTAPSPGAELRCPSSTIMTDPRRARLDAALRGGVRAVPRGGPGPGAGQPGAHPHLPRHDRQRGMARPRRRAAAASGRRPAPISRRRRLGGGRTAAVGGGDARIKAVLPRFSRFSRRAAGDPTEEQIVAANIDIVFLVGGLDHDFNPRRIERYLLVASESGATPVIVLNKADLVEDPQVAIDRGPRARAGGRGPCRDAAARPESLEPLLAHLAIGRTGALLGSSGVGKSSIVNSLVGHDAAARRTTCANRTAAAATPAPTGSWCCCPDGGLLIDTPGMRELQLWDTGEALAATFADIDALAAQCRFRDCRHRVEPGCAVVAAVGAGELPAGRLESYPQARGRAGAPASGSRTSARRSTASAGPERLEGAAEAAQGQGRLLRSTSGRSSAVHHRAANAVAGTASPSARRAGRTADRQEAARSRAVR